MCASRDRGRRHVEQRRPRFQTRASSATSWEHGSSRLPNRAISPGISVSLAHDVELTGDGGGRVPALARTPRGRSRVAARTRSTGRAWAPAFRACRCVPSRSNGGPVAIIDAQQRVIGVLALDIAGEHNHRHQLDRQPRQARRTSGQSLTSIATEVGKMNPYVLAPSPRAAVKDSARLQVRVAYAALAWVVVFFAFHAQLVPRRIVRAQRRSASLVPDSVAGWIGEVLEGAAWPLGDGRAWRSLADGRMAGHALPGVDRGLARLLSARCPRRRRAHR